MTLKFIRFNNFSSQQHPMVGKNHTDAQCDFTQFIHTVLDKDMD